jgi:type II secretory pathway pseudopilin PulG
MTTVRREGAFSLLELLLALALGLVLCGVMLQGLLADGQTSLRLSRLVREKDNQRRTLDLVQRDLQRSLAVSPVPTAEASVCGLAGRLPVLHLRTQAAPITYSVGAAPSGIWRGQVLMRCGPAFGLDGATNWASASQNRVVIDGLAPAPEPWRSCPALLAIEPTAVMDLAQSSRKAFSACLDPLTGVVGLRLAQEFGSGAKRHQRIESLQLVAPAEGAGP